MDSTLLRRLFALVLVCAPFVSGCACSRGVSTDDLRDRGHEWDRATSFGTAPVSSRPPDQDAQYYQEQQEQRAKNEADFRSRNPGR